MLEPKQVCVGCLIRLGRTRPQGLHGDRASVSCQEPRAYLPGFMKSQSHVICPFPKKPLVTEGAAGLCCGRPKGTLRKVSELGRGTAGRGIREQKIPEWGTQGQRGALRRDPQERELEAPKGHSCWEWGGRQGRDDQRCMADPCGSAFL